MDIKKIDMPRGSMGIIIVEQLQSEVYKHLAALMYRSDVQPNEMNPISWKILITLAKSSFELKGRPGPTGDEVRVKEWCWRLRQVGDLTGLTYEQLLSSLPDKKRGQPPKHKAEAANAKQTYEKVAELIPQEDREWWAEGRCTQIYSHLEKILELLQLDTQTSLYKLHNDLVLKHYHRLKKGDTSSLKTLYSYIDQEASDWVVKVGRLRNRVSIIFEEAPKNLPEIRAAYNHIEFERKYPPKNMD